MLHMKYHLYLPPPPCTARDKEIHLSAYLYPYLLVMLVTVCADVYNHVDHWCKGIMLYYNWKY